MDVRKAAEELQPHLVELRRDFHAHPETSGNEKETAERIVKELEAIGGYQIRTGVSGTYGIIAELRGALPGKTVALRADMDALSVTEYTELPMPLRIRESCMPADMTITSPCFSGLHGSSAPVREN